MKKNDVLKALYCFLSLLTMAVIFWFSSQNGEQSGGQSNALSEFFLKILKPNFENLNENEKQQLLNTTSQITRTIAHFGIYLILALFVTAFTNTYNIKRKKVIIYSLIFCLIYSVSDEIHQIYVDGRTFQIIDIIIDNIGNLTGAFLFFVIKRFYRIIKYKIMLHKYKR